MSFILARTVQILCTVSHHAFAGIYPVCGRPDKAAAK